MREGIGSTIYRLRREAGYTQSQLCKGVCSISELAKFENEELMLNHLQIDRLFSRLGKASAKLLYILPKEIYAIYEIRYEIQRCIVTRKLEEAEEFLRQYEEMKRSREPLNRQNIEMQRAQISWMQGEKEQAYVFIQKAIERTIYEENAVERRDALSADELNMLLFRWEVCSEGKEKREIEEVKKILEYSEYHCTDREELAKVFPYAALLLAKQESPKYKDELAHILKKALDLLREEGKIFLMPEIIEEYVKRKEFFGKPEETEQLEKARAALIEVGKKFQIDFDKLHLFEQVNRDFELDYEVIRKTRIAQRLSQEQVCEEICTRETLSRIEQGKNSPTQKNLRKIMEGLDREGERVNTVIMSEDYAVLEKKREITKCLHRLEYGKARLVLEELRQQLDESIPKNRQYILGNSVRIDSQEKKISYEDTVKKLYEALSMTLNGNGDEIFDYPLTISEFDILNKIAILHHENGKTEETIHIYQKIFESQEKSMLKEVFYVRTWETVTANLASLLEMSEKVRGSLEITEKRIKITMEIGRGIDLGRAFSTMACALEQERNPECKKYFEWSLSILYLMKNYARYELAKEYMNRPGFLSWMN